MHQLPLRGFWRRWVLVFCGCVIGLIIVIVTKKNIIQPISPLKLSKFIWLDLNNVTHLTKCRNSRQGPHLIADEKGQLCKMTEVSSNGCCSHHGNSTEQFVCASCQVNRCCRVFEHCVSCCLQPRKKFVLEKVLLQAQNSRNPLLRLVQDTFELCLHKCRTSSTSVLRENRYRNNLYKYCYGVDPPHMATGRNAK